MSAASAIKHDIGRGIDGYRDTNTGGYRAFPSQPQKLAAVGLMIHLRLTVHLEYIEQHSAAGGGYGGGKGGGGEGRNWM